MSLEAQIAELTAALNENTEAHTKLAGVAAAAAAGRAEVSKSPPKDEPSEDEAPKETAAEKKKRLAAEKKAAEKKAAASKKAEAPELSGSVTLDELKPIAGGFLKSDDEDVRDANKKNFLAALQHLGASKLTEVDTDEDRARLAGYIAYWNAGLEVDFEAVDEIVAAASGDGEGDDDLLG